MAETVLEGTLNLIRYKEEAVDYVSFGAEYTTTETAKTYNDTLEDIFTTACGVSQLNLTLNTDAARGTSPAVNYTVANESMLIDNLSDMAAFFSHAFYIEDGTLYLIDLLLNNGTSELDEFGYFRGAEYGAPQPYSLIKGGDYHQDGSYPYGSELDISPVCHTTQANIETALTDIKTLVEYDRYRFRVIPEADQMPVIGQKITITNDSLQDSTTTWLRVTDFSPDIFRSEILIEGFGVST